MAKNITYFDREHTGGINLAAMEDTQLKENLVQDIAAGGEEAPTATAVKEAVDVKMDKADIVNDLTTGGTDKALSAEQGKVLEGKKVDKLTDAIDLVYVHGSDGTEQGKALADFAMKAEVTDFVELDSASMPNTLATLANVQEDGIFKKWVYVDTTELGTAKDGDIVQLTVAGKNYFGILGGPQVGTGAAIDDEMLNTTLPASGNWQGWSRIYIANSEDNTKVVNKKLDKLTGATDLVYVHGSDGTEQGKALSEFVVDTDIVNDRVTGGVDKVLAAEVGKDIPASFELSFTAANYPLTAATIDKTKYTYHVMSISTLYIHPDEIPVDIKGKIKKGDIVSTTVASPILSCKAIFSYIATAGETSTNVTSDIVNTSLPAAGNWEGWYAFQVIVSEQDRIRTEGKTNTYATFLFDGDETLETLPDLGGPMPTGGFSYSIVFIKPEDIKANRLTTGIPATYVKQVDGSTIKPGDILIIETPNSAEATKKIRSMHCLITHTAARNTQLGPHIMNTKLPAAGSWEGWLVGRILSSGWDREALLSKTDSTKMQNYMVTLPTEGETFASMPDINKVGSGKGASGSNFFVYPDDIASIAGSLKRGDIVIFTGAVSTTGETFETVTAIYTGAIATGTELLGEADLNETPPAAGNYKGWYIFYTLSSVYDRRTVQKKVNHFKTSLQSTGKTWPTIPDARSNVANGLASGVVYIHPDDLPDIADKIKEGDTLNCITTSPDSTGKYLFNMTLKYYRVGTDSDKLNEAVLNNTLPAEGSFKDWLRFYTLSTGYDRKALENRPNFWQMRTSAGDSNIPVGLKSVSQIAFASNTDTAAFADALKRGDLIEIANSAGIMYIAEFTRYAIAADNTNGNKDLVVGQATPPADITGYLFCNIIASTYDTDGTIVYRTNKYQPNQFEVGKSYRINITVSESTEQLELYGLYIDQRTFEEYNCVIRRGFKIGDMVNLLLENGTKSVILLVTLGFAQADNSIHVLCIANGENQIATDLG